MKKNLSKLLIIFITFLLTNSIIYKSYADDYIENEQTIDVSSEILEANMANSSALEPSSINSRSCVVFDRNSHMIL